MPDASELVAAADTLSEASLYTEAISTYTKAIELAPTSPSYYIKRSTAYQRSGQLEAALKDAEQAVVLAQQRAKADLIAAAQIRRGISLNGLKRYADSNEIFKLAKKSSKDKSIDIWMSKNNAALAKLSEEEKQAKIDAIPKELPYSLPVNLPEDEATEKNDSQTTVKEKEPVEKTTAPESSAPAAAPLPTRVRHEWYQTDQHVFVDMFFKNIPKDKCVVDLEPHSLTVIFPLPTGSDFTFTLDPLANPIDPATSSYEVLSTKLSLKLTKASRGQKWGKLELPAGTLPATTTTTATTAPVRTTAPPAKGIAYPTSSRTGPKNWDAIEREIVKEAESSEKPEGDAAANALFRDLFKNATPEVRMAMEKSYVESNGTALSTNWDEVSKGRVETKPPDSMVAKKWGK